MMRHVDYSLGIGISATERPEAPPSDRRKTTSMVKGLKDVRVLVVDDDEAITAMLTRFLGLSFRWVLGALSGAEAIESFSREPSDVIICDLHIGDANGLEVCGAIRRLCQATDHRKPFMILLHGSFDPGASPDRMEECGIDMVAQKPMDLGTLMCVMDGVLERRFPT